MRLALYALLLLLLPGCAGLWPHTTEPTPTTVEPTLGPNEPSLGTGKRASEEELRLRIQRFADEFTQAISEPLDEVIRSDAPLQRRQLALDMKYDYGSAAYTIASGAHASVAVLDMVVFVSLTRDTIERWGVEYAGQRQTDLLLLVLRHFEEKLWGIARLVVTPEQEASLRTYLVEWRENFPNRKSVENVRVSDFVSTLDLEDRAAASGLVSSVRQATQAADQALELAERLAYFFQRAPLLWRMHAQIGFFEIVSQPEMQDLLTNAEQMSASAERLSLNLDRFSHLLIEGPTTPEEAALFENLEGGETRVRALMGELQQTLEQASALTRNVDGLAERFNVGGTLEPGEKPFDVADYEALAAQVTTMSRGMTGLVQHLNQLLASPNVQERLPLAVGSAQAISEDFVLYVIALGLAMICSSILAAVFALLGYRYLAARLDARLDKRHHV